MHRNYIKLHLKMKHKFKNETVFELICLNVRHNLIWLRSENTIKIRDYM